MASWTVIIDKVSYNLTSLFQALSHQITSQIISIPSKISCLVTGIQNYKSKDIQYYSLRERKTGPKTKTYHKKLSTWLCFEVLSGVKRTQGEAEHANLSNAEIKHECIYNFTHPKCLHGATEITIPLPLLLPRSEGRKQNARKNN